jgi:hypothetical protein
MGQRYTRKDIQNCGRRLAQAVGHEFGDDMSGCYEKQQVDGKWKPKEGCLRVDYNPTYGGSIVEQMVGEQGGVQHPFGEGRLKGYEFCRATRYGEGAVELYKKRKGQ